MLLVHVEVAIQKAGSLKPVHVEFHSALHIIDAFIESIFSQ